MDRCIHLTLLVVSTCVLVWISCISTPSDPADDPKNSYVSLFVPEDNYSVQAGSTKEICMRAVLPQHFDFYRMTSSCGDYDTTFTFVSTSKDDTLHLYPRFNHEGTCTLRLTAFYLDSRYNEKSDSLIMVVLPGEPGIDFAVTPSPFSTHTGATDTLRFIVSASQVDDISYTVKSDPEINSANMHLITPVDDDTVSIHFDPAAAGTYTITLEATAGELNTSASVTITVLESIAPTSSENPQTLITGIPDTLIFTFTPDQVARGVSMALLDAVNLPADKATVIPGGSDSLLIAVTPMTEGTLSFSIATTSGELTDTTGYTFSFVDQNNVVWSTASASHSATEGAAGAVDLTRYFFEDLTLADVSLSADIGTIDENGTWHFTPPWGSDATASGTISGKRGEVTQNLTLAVTVAAGDVSDPVITLATPSTETKTIGSSRTTVSVTVTDEGAGVAEVRFSYGDTTIAGTMEGATVWSAVIAELVAGTPTVVVITATDASMNRNSSQATVILTYDPTTEDTDAPVISQVGGPQSGSRVTDAEGTVSCTITDDSGVDSVWWTLGGEDVAVPVADENGEYAIHYALTTFGENSITLYAKDGSAGGNEGSKTFTLNYNTVVSAVTPSGPEDGAENVNLTPTFSWTGGEDADGDTVFFRVLYGTSAAALTQSTDVLTGNIITLTTGEELSATTTFCWQVIAWSKVFPDTVKSAVVSFTTLDPTAEDVTGPSIAQTAGPEDGERVTGATGTITVSVSDPNSVASVTATLNNGTALALTAGANNAYSFDYNIAGSYGENTVTFTAVDGSANSNSSEETIAINYNTEPSAVMLTTPAANANGVSTSPTFDWSGGDDADGDGVTFTVRYGTSQANLSGTASVSGKTATVGSALDYQQTYYWQVTAVSASTAYPDEVQSAVGTFTTGGSLPTISVHPQSQSVEEGESVTFSVTASANGFGTLSYQWRVNGSDIGGQTGASCTISSVTTNMDGNIYDCVVTNAVGDETSNEATLTVTTVPIFTVSFWTENSTPKPDDQIVERGGYATRPTEVPQRAGYKFTDWYIENASSAFDFTGTPITDNLQLVAGWVAVYSVTYHADDADGGTVPTDPNEYESGDWVTVANNTGNLSRDGNNYRFIGWTTSEDGSGTVLTNPQTIQMGSANIDLYAKWEMNAPTFTTTITNQSCPVNDAVTFTVAATGAELSYEWYLNNSEVGSGTSYTTSNLTKNEISTSRTYKCVVTNSAGSDECSATLSVSTVTDASNNVYHEIKLVNKIWMMENLKTTKYNDGSSIQYLYQGDPWTLTTIGSYCWREDDIADKAYGALYNWPVVQSGKLPPQGWRLPTEAEWTALFNAYDPCELRTENQAQGGYNWDGCSSYPSADFCGFNTTALGFIDAVGLIHSLGGGAFWWVTEEIQAYTIFGSMGDITSDVVNYGCIGCGVRCVKE